MAENEVPVMEQAADSAAPIAAAPAATAPAKVELTIEEQFAKLAQEKDAIHAKIAEIDDTAVSLGFANGGAEGVPSFMKANYDSLQAQLAGFAEREKALWNKVPTENALAFLKSLAGNFASFGFKEPVIFSVSFDPKDNTVTAKAGGSRAAAPKKEGAAGAGSSAITSRTTTLNEKQYPSAAAALDEARTILGLAPTYGEGNSAVRVLNGLQKAYPDKIRVTFGA